jgi:hypothetical protein
MPTPAKFDPELLSIIECKMVTGRINSPESFDKNLILSYDLKNNINLGFNRELKLAKIDYTCEIASNSGGKNQQESKANFHFVFYFKIQNLEDLTHLRDEKNIELDPILANTLASLTFSTTRGILLMRLHGTALEEFILPVINPANLLINNQNINAPGIL